MAKEKRNAHLTILSLLSEIFERYERDYAKIDGRDHDDYVKAKILLQLLTRISFSRGARISVRRKLHFFIRKYPCCVLSFDISHYLHFV